MEEKRGTISHMTGIIRLIAFIVLVVIALFFIFRWAANRRAERRAEEAVKTAVNHENEGGDTGDSAETSEQDAEPKEGAGSDTANTDTADEKNQTIAVPDGIADGGESASVPSNVPATGMGENIIATTAFICFTTYLAVRNSLLRRQLKSML